jgi:hypothetical protein
VTPYQHGFVFLFEVGVAGVALLLVRGQRALLALFLATLLGSVATIVIVPNLDRTDVQRHLIAAQLSLRIALFAVLVAALDDARAESLGPVLARLRRVRALPTAGG